MTTDTRAIGASYALRGYLIALVSTAFLSFTGILIKYLLINYPLSTVTLAFWRVFFVALGLGLALAVFRPRLLRVRSRDLPLFAIYGVLGIGIHQLVWITSVGMNGAALATVLVSIQPAIVLIISWRVLGERFDRLRVIALGLTLVGVVLVSRVYEAGNANLNGLGILIGLGSGLTWATYALVSRYATRRYSPWTCTWYAFVFGLALLLPLQFLVPSPASPPGDFGAGLTTLFSIGTLWSGWGVLLLLALGPTLSGFALYTVGLSHLPASSVTIIGALEQVFSIILAFIIFHEVLNPAQLVGAALILWSIIMLRPRA